MLINKETLPLVDMDFMNDVHFEDVIILNNLYEKIEKCEQKAGKSIEEEIDVIYGEWIEHTKGHYLGEEKEMLAKGFPPYMMHKMEHTQSLQEIAKIFSDWKESRNIVKLKEYIGTEHIAWLIHHIESMDTVTATFFKTGKMPCH